MSRIFTVECRNFYSTQFRYPKKSQQKQQAKRSSLFVKLKIFARECCVVQRIFYRVDFSRAASDDKKTERKRRKLRKNSTDAQTFFPLIRLSSFPNSFRSLCLLRLQLVAVCFCFSFRGAWMKTFLVSLRQLLLSDSGRREKKSITVIAFTFVSDSSATKSDFNRIQMPLPLLLNWKLASCDIEKAFEIQPSSRKINLPNGGFFSSEL